MSEPSSAEHVPKKEKDSNPTADQRVSMTPDERLAAKLQRERTPAQIPTNSRNHVTGHLSSKSQRNESMNESDGLQKTRECVEVVEATSRDHPEAASVRNSSGDRADVVRKNEGLTAPVCEDEPIIDIRDGPPSNWSTAATGGSISFPAQPMSIAEDIEGAGSTAAPLPTAYVVNEDIPEAVNVDFTDSQEKENRRGSGETKRKQKICLILVLFVLGVIPLSIGLTIGFKPVPSSSVSSRLPNDDRFCNVPAPPLNLSRTLCPKDNVTISYSSPSNEERYCKDEYCWVRVGPTIRGPSNFRFGEVVDLSADGSRFVVSAYDGDSCDVERVGTVRVYDVNDSDFVPVGQAIVGIERNERSRGFLSGDGKRVAVGSPENEGPCGLHRAGSVRVYAIRNDLGGNWSLIGKPIYGREESGELGRDMALSYEGSIVAAGAARTNVSVGSVQVYQYALEGNRSVWKQLGNDILAKDATARDEFGASLALSKDGLTIAIGQQSENRKSGRIAVFRYQNGSWIQLGEDIEGEEKNDKFGKTVDISSDGFTVVGGAKDSTNKIGSGNIRAFSFNEKDNTWEQLGSPILSGPYDWPIFERTGDSNKTIKASRVSMSTGGSNTRIAVMTKKAIKDVRYVREYITELPGFAAIFDWNKTHGIWQQIGGSIVLDNQTDAHGGSISISSDGKRVLIGRAETSDSSVNLYELKSSQQQSKS